MIKDLKFREYKGKSGETWLVGVTEDWENHIYVSTDPCGNKPGYKGFKGFGGGQLKFIMEDGSRYFLIGPWHSNSNSFFEDTGIDSATFKP